MVETSALDRMCTEMCLRGPDGSGAWAANRIALGHRRLKIIDLSEASRQPMVDSELGLSIVYNGAIYNYKELRAELEGKGYRFFSHGDTEVILKAYHAFGESFVEKLNGMFAFAIAERETGRLILGRDRLGIKPFYYSLTGDRLRFSSSLPGIIAAGGIDTSIDPVALQYYLTYHSVVPAPHTIVNGIRKLPPATIAFIEPNGKMTSKKYWSVNYGTDDSRKDYSKEDWINETLEVMRTAVKRRLVADVPVGVLLSGGLDSSLIVGLLCEHDPSAVETFSIGFESVNDEEGDEFKYSDIIVDRFQTSLHKLFIDSNKTIPALRGCIRQMSEPMVSHDNVGFYLLSKEVSKFVKVVQSGQGADEVFAGYFWYKKMMESTNGVADYASIFFDRDYAEYSQVVTDRYRCDDDNPLNFIKNHFDSPGATRPVDQALRVDSNIMLVDDPVKRVDNNTMAASLEARVPFLDHEVVEFAAKMPAEMKVPGDGKYALKEAARKVIPAGVIDRPKGYFPVPALKYLKGEFLEMTREALINDTARERGLFNSNYVEKLLKSPEDHITSLGGSKLYQLALLEMWLQTHGIR
jgi:asparagine synthase (glutamine-hydrolysing)